MANELLSQFEPRVAIIPAVMTAASHTGNVFNGAGYDRCMFILALGSGAGASTLTFAISKSAASDGTFTEVTGASFVSFSSTITISNRCAVMDIPVDPAKPWMETIDTVGTATLNGACIALLYKPSGVLPPTAQSPTAGSFITAKSVRV